MVKLTADYTDYGRICYHRLVFLKVHKALLGLLFLAAFSPVTTYADDQIRIDLPDDAQIKVRNDFGNVTVEVWANNYVAVSAAIGGDGSTRLTRSPILIDNRGSLVTISVVRRPLDPHVPIHLKIMVPADVDITARSLRGTTKPFQTRIGNGGKKIDIQTETGEVLLTYSSATESSSASTPKQPELLGTTGNRHSSAGTPADTTPTGEISEGDIIRVDSQLVTLNISVIDRGTNRGLLGLDQSDFKLFEDGQEQQIVQFESSSAPFDLVLLIDLSGSTREVVKLIRAAAIRFVEAARPADRIGVITFAGEATVVSALTADRELLRQRIETIDTARGDTKLYDATNFAMEEVLKDAKKSRRSAIVLMSDGLDGTIPGVSGQQGSRHSYQETLRNIQEFDGVLYTLWLNTEYEAMSPLDTQPEAFDAAYDRMKEMADAGGGVFYKVEKLTDLAGAYEQVVADLGTMYSLAYRPSNSTRDGQWRSIRIAVSRTNAVPRGKRGYYAN
ncbi:MAG TPA: VWA domain-containing protein [Pyrinomonadaceae bacterium]|nr:VWA domain-containing protein [Pyrinomonadaceae bacterium]